MANTDSASHVRVIEETPAYWRVVFDYPPFNVVDACIFEALQDLLTRMNANPSLRVVVFESANPEFYLSHFDLTGKIGNIMTAVGPSGLPILMDTFVRLTKSPVVSIAKIRGCVRGVSSELSSPATCASRRARTRDSANPKSGWDCIPAGAARNVFHIWSGAAGRSKSFSAGTTSTGTPRNDTDMSTGHFQTPNWTSSPACYRRCEESRQPCLVAVRRPTSRRHHFF
jgi:enoyl-CoA hydratase/carnithine racemase